MLQEQKQLNHSKKNDLDDKKCKKFLKIFLAAFLVLYYIVTQIFNSYNDSLFRSKVESFFN